MRRSQSLLAPLALLLPLSLAACGSDSSSSSAGVANSVGTSAPATTNTPSPTPEGPTYKRLSLKELNGALLGVDSLPVGWSQDPPNNDDSAAKYCGFAPEHAPLRPSHDFTKGGGFTTEIASVQLAQYPSEAIASRNVERLRKGLDTTCHGEEVDGSQLKYAIMSAPKLNHPTLGIRITGEGATVLVFAAQVGPTVVTSGTGGVTTADVDLAARLLKEQVASYENASLQS